VFNPLFAAGKIAKREGKKNKGAVKKKGEGKLADKLL